MNQCIPHASGSLGVRRCLSKNSEEAIRFGRNQLIFTRFSLSSTEPVPFRRFGSALPPRK